MDDDTARHPLIYDQVPVLDAHFPVDFHEREFHVGFGPEKPPIAHFLPIFLGFFPDVYLAKDQLLCSLHEHSPVGVQPDIGASCWIPADTQ